MQADLITTLLFVGAAHSIFMATTLVALKRGNRIANRIFAALLCTLALAIMFHALASTDFLLKHPHFSKIEPSLVTLFGPLFFLYVAAMTDRSFRFERKDLGHALPLLLCLLILAPYYFGSTAAKIEHISEDRHESCAACLAIYWLVLVQLLVYMVLISRRLVSYKKQIENAYSSLERINLNWLRNLLIGVALAWMLSLALHVTGPTLETGNYLWLVIAVQIFFIGYRGLRQPEVFSGGVEPDALSAGVSRKYEKSTLTPENAARYLEKLNAMMQKDKPFLESDLSLPALAKRLAISTHHLSQIINDRLGQNFFEFINQHRVDEARKKIKASEGGQKNLAEIGLDVGFNSISSFNAAFKKHAGVTPSEYRRSLSLHKA